MRKRADFRVQSSITLRLDKLTYAWLKAHSGRLGKSMSFTVADMLQQRMKRGSK